MTNETKNIWTESDQKAFDFEWDFELFKKCDGKHSTLLELFACESCALLLREDIK